MDIPKLTIETGLKMGAIAVGCAVISIVFCMVLNGVAGAYGRWFKNPYVRVVVGSCLVIGITLLLGTSDYMGAGAELIEKAVEEGQARPLETGTDCIDNACRVPWRGDCAIVLYWGDVWLCDGKLAGTFSVYLCGVRNDSSILWSNELSDHIDSDRI